MVTETHTIEIPLARVSADGRYATIGLPEGLDFGDVTACGDGIHVFKPLTWKSPKDEICACGNIEPGLPVYWCPVVETIVIPDPCGEGDVCPAPAGGA